MTSSTTIELTKKFTDKWNCHLCGEQLKKGQNCGAMEVEEVYFSLDIPNRVDATFLQFHVSCIKMEIYH